MMHSLKAASLGRMLLAAALAAEGLLLLEPDGALVRAAQHGRDPASELALSWWRNSPVHMGCSMADCTRPATHTATYRQWTPRGAVWRAYGFCQRHSPPADSAGLIYRLGKPPSFQYDIPLSPVRSEIYFLLGVSGFCIWCAGMWRYSSGKGPKVWLGMTLLHVLILTALWNYTHWLR